VVTSAVPGTTRDVVAAEVELAGIKVLLLDSAGQTETASKADQLAIHEAGKWLELADAVVFVTEANRSMTQREKELCDAVECPMLLVANKSDLGVAGEHSRNPRISCISGEGLENLKSLLERLVSGGTERHPDALVLSIRQQDAVDRSIIALKRAEDAGAIELVAQDIRETLNAIGEITGATLPEEILDKIFEQFCIGK
jgi:tRNA modification GTPase